MSMRKLEGRVAIITGSGGIGRACASRFASEGATVLIGDIDEHSGREAADIVSSAGGTAMFRPLDITSEDSVESFYAWTEAVSGRLDILLNNAACTSPDQMLQDMGLAKMSTQIWDRAFEVNTRGAMLMTKHAIILMTRTGNASIINMSSGASVRGDFYGPAYAASKAALNCLSLYTATQYGKQGIRCNTIAPGLIVTENARTSSSSEQFERILTHELTPYLGAPEDVAAAATFLASEEARFITGHTIILDGGFNIHMPYYADVQANFIENSETRTI